MTTASRDSHSKVNELPADLIELCQALQALPAEHGAAIKPLVERVQQSAKRRRRILTLVQEALGQLRVDMKYLMFDLEATRRERDSFRDQLNQEDGQDNGG